MTRLAGLLQCLESNEADPDTVRTLMREIHTLKGEARLMGFARMSDVCHQVEDLFDAARRNDFDLDPDLSELIYRGLDLLSEYAADPEQARLDEASLKFEEAVSAQLSIEPPPEDREEASHADARVSPTQPAPPPTSVPETRSPTHSTGGAQDTSAESRETGGPEKSPGVATSRLEQDFVRVPTETVTRLTNLVADLLRRQEVMESDLRTLTERVAGPILPMVRQLRDRAFESHLRLTEIQDTLRQLGLLEVGLLFERYPPAVRALARDQGKQVRVLLQGTDVAVDKRVLDRIDDALLHLLRNSVDHGIEPPDERTRLGKRPQGTIVLRARQVGTHVEIQVEDDGRGVDVARVRESALERGLLSPERAASLNEDDILQLVFQPGFSTRDDVTDLSGRGVGLDVVRQDVENLGGSVHLATQEGIGTTFSLRLPISISLTKLLLVEAGGQSWAIPSSQIETLLRIDPEALERAGGGLLVRTEGRRIPLTDLSTLLADGTNGEETAEGRIDVVVLSHAGQQLAVRVDRFLREYEAVQRSTGEFLAGVRLVHGALLVEGGRPALVLNVPELLQRFGEGRAHYASRLPGEAGTRRRTILVVEDSELTRDMLVHAANRLGLQVFEAVNGKEALKAVDTAVPDLVLTDLDMPVMDGFDLISALRQRNETRDVPIVVLSTRGSEEDRRRAAEAGADAYLVKTSFTEASLKSVVERFLSPGP